MTEEQVRILSWISCAAIILLISSGEITILSGWAPQQDSLHVLLQWSETVSDMAILTFLRRAMESI